MTVKMAAVALAAGVLAGCASNPVAPTPSVVRTAAPVNYESAVNNYFDFRVRGPRSKRTLTIGMPEPSDCMMKGGGGVYAGWVVPVIYSTATTSGAAASSGSPTHSAPHPAAVAVPAPAATTGPRGAEARPVARTRGRTASRPARDGTTHTSAQVIAAPVPAEAENRSHEATPTASLGEVSITGKSYFFWFSRETINAVTERSGCP